MAMRDHHPNPHKSVAGTAEKPEAFLERYWHAIADANQALPARHQMEPRALGPILSHCFVLQRISHGMARFRLAGQNVERIMGLDLRTMPFSAIFQGPARIEIERVLLRIFDTPAIARMQLQAKPGLGRPRLNATMLLCPLADETGQVSRAIGTLSATGKTGRHPRRLMIDSVQIEPVPGSCNSLENAEAAEPHTAMARAFAEPPAPFRHRSQAHLRLVVDNG